MKKFFLLILFFIPTVFNTVRAGDTLQVASMDFREETLNEYVGANQNVA